MIWQSQWNGREANLQFITQPHINNRKKTDYSKSMVQKLHTFEMSKGKPQRITHLRNSFQLHTVSCITNIQQLSAPFRYFPAKHKTFSFELGRKKCTFSLASTQTNLITFQMDTILNRKPAWVVCLELQQAARLFLSNWNPPTLLLSRAAGSATNQTNKRPKDPA